LPFSCFAPHFPGWCKPSRTDWHENLNFFLQIKKMESSPTVLHGSTDREKGAYLGAIASIATADRHATPEEVEYLTQLCTAANLSSEQKEAVIKASTEISDEEVRRCLDELKTSDLKYSLVTDLIAFAKSDDEYSQEEQKTIREMAAYLGVNQEQFSLLDSFTEKAKSTLENNAATAPNGATPNAFAGVGTENNQTDFLSSLGLKDKLQKAGINGNGLLKGLLGIAAPMILAKMVTGGLQRNRSGGMFGGGGGMFGGSGGMFGGSGGMFGGGGGLLGGGLGSLFSILSGGGGYRRSGGLLSRIFRGGF
jgi:uncharacterized tellurite resistance protein B-like protein